MCATKDATQCFDVASEIAMTVMRHDTGNFSLCLQHGDDFEMTGSRTPQRVRGTFVQTSHRQVFCHIETMHSNGRRHRGQNIEQDCVLGQHCGSHSVSISHGEKVILRWTDCSQESTDV